MEPLTRHASGDECHWPRLVHAKIISSNETKVLNVCLLCELFKSWMFVQEEFNSGSLTKFSNIQVAYRRSKGSAANKSKRNQPLLKLELVLKNRSLPYTLFTFKILKGNAFPIKNHFSFDIDVSDMEVEENICKWNIFVLFWFFCSDRSPRRHNVGSVSVHVLYAIKLSEWL